MTHGPWDDPEPWFPTDSVPGTGIRRELDLLVSVYSPLEILGTHGLYPSVTIKIYELLFCRTFGGDYLFKVLKILLTEFDECPPGRRHRVTEWGKVSWSLPSETSPSLPPFLVTFGFVVVVFVPSKQCLTYWKTSFYLLLLRQRLPFTLLNRILTTSRTLLFFYFYHGYFDKVPVETLGFLTTCSYLRVSRSSLQTQNSRRDDWSTHRTPSVKELRDNSL